MATQFRPGALGALMDEYERAADDLVRVLEPLSPEQYEAVVAPDTEDEDCRSIRTVVAHVAGAAYGYADYLRDSLAMEKGERPAGPPTLEEAIPAVRAALAYTAETLAGRWEMGTEEAVRVVLETKWGSTYHIEQMLEHAIVHVLRHRRQIERFLRPREGG